MLGDGKGTFSSVHPSESNFYLTGEIPDMSIIKIGSRKELGVMAIQNDRQLRIMERKTASGPSKFNE